MAAETRGFSHGAMTGTHPEGEEDLSPQGTSSVRKTEMVHFSLNCVDFLFPSQRYCLLLHLFCVLAKLLRSPPCWKTHSRHPITGDWTVWHYSNFVKYYNEHDLGPLKWLLRSSLKIFLFFHVNFSWSCTTICGFQWHSTTCPLQVFQAWSRTTDFGRNISIEAMEFWIWFSFLFIISQKK